MRKSQSKQIPIPSLTEASPEYGALLNRLRELEARRAEIEREIHKVQRGRIPSGMIDHASRGRSERAAALLGDVLGADAPTFDVKPSAADIAEHLDKLRIELADVEAAIAILKLKQSPAHTEASRLVCEMVRGGYEAAIRRTALALAPALAAHREMLRITGNLSDTDVRWVSHLAQPTNLRRALGDPWDKDTAPDRFIQEAIASGFVTEKEIEEASNG